MPSDPPRRIRRYSERRISKGPTLLVVEDSQETRQRLASVAQQAFPNGAVIATACVRDSLDALMTQPIDMALVDLELPDGSGIEVVQESSRMSPLTRCVISTMHDDDQHLTLALAAGALGYLLSDQPEAVLVQQLRLLAEGIPPLAPSIALRLVHHFAEMQKMADVAATANQPRTQEHRVRLSEREQQVLSLIAKGMQIAEVAQLLKISANTVCSHIKSIYRKRHVTSRAEAALEARRLGLV